jgi:2-keto-4-pentenoate hydratase/2-oxohepta-3-ene-1,7-dioic acid hydratase in catechol pathway
VAFAASYAYVTAQGGTRTPFKLGTFERQNRVFVGLSVRDTQVADLAEANAAFERRNGSASKVRMPADMKELIAHYDAELRDRLSAIAADLSSQSAAPYVYDIKDLKVHPPVRPSAILNAGGNYEEHSQGIAQQQQRAAGQAPTAPPPTQAVTAPGIWERKTGDTRDNPYLFLKSPSVVVGAFDPIRIPRGRDKIDFECEFDVVMGKVAKHVPIDRAADYIFGYTIQIDVSDRGGRGDRKMGGSDWLVGKNHDTFGPLGPFVVPKEFIKDPKNVRHTFTLNGDVMQDSNTSRMSHNIFELLHYASNIMSLHPGDVISGGSPAGTNIERAQPRWMRAGDTAVCTIEGIGTQRHAVVNDDTATN